MFVLEKFCFFLSLSSGTLTIGVINLAYGLLHTALEIETALQFHRMSLEDDNHKYSRAANIIYSDNSIPSMQLLFGAYIIHGVIKTKPNFLFAAVIMLLALIAYSSGFIVVTLLVLIVQESQVPNSEQVLNEALKIPVMLYFAIVIYSYYEKITTQSPPFIDASSRRQDDDDEGI